MSLDPLAAEHLEHARHNHALYERLASEGQFRDWAIVLLFYAALHLVQAHAIQHGEPLRPTSHEARREYVSRRLASFARHYTRLRRLSEDARYERWMPDEQQVRDAHDRDFQHIVAQLRNRGISL
jgi:hypothetical protein